MRLARRDPAARKRTVSLSLNSDLFARAKAAGLNASKLAEEALARALDARMAEQAKAEAVRDLAAYDAYVAKHGSPAELAREHYRKRGDAV